MLATERRRRALALVHAKGAMSITELERRLAVSRMTIYRDLEALIAEGQLERVHGGVVLPNRAGRLPLADPGARPLEERVGANRPAKRQIARHLAALLRDARSAVVDNSSTVYHLAEVLGGHDLFLVTGGVSLYLELQRRAPPGVRAALHGGEPHPRTGSLVGPLAAGSLERMRFDVAVVSCLGVMRDEGTVYVSNPEEGEIKRLYLQRSRRKVLALDRSKLGRAGPYVMAPLSDFDQIVTEAGVEWIPGRGASPVPARRARR